MACIVENNFRYTFVVANSNLVVSRIDVVTAAMFVVTDFRLTELGECDGDGALVVCRKLWMREVSVVVRASLATMLLARNINLTLHAFPYQPLEQMRVPFWEQT